MQLRARRYDAFCMVPAVLPQQSRFFKKSLSRTPHSDTFGEVKCPLTLISLTSVLPKAGVKSIFFNLFFSKETPLPRRFYFFRSDSRQATLVLRSTRRIRTRLLPFLLIIDYHRAFPLGTSHTSYFIEASHKVHLIRKPATLKF